MLRTAAHSCCTMKPTASQLVHVNLRITTRELCTELNTGFSDLETMVATLEYYKICTGWVTQMLTQEQKEHCTQAGQDLLNQYDT